MDIRWRIVLPVAIAVVADDVLYKTSFNFDKLYDSCRVKTMHSTIVVANNIEK